MLGIVVPLIVTYYIYKNAKENGRNAVLWAVINLAVFFGTQLIIGLAAGIFIAFGIEAWGWNENLLEQNYFLLNLAGLAIGGFGSYLVFRHVTRVPDSAFYEPPPPPQFN